MHMTRININNQVKINYRFKCQKQKCEIPSDKHREKYIYDLAIGKISLGMEQKAHNYFLND